MLRRGPNRGAGGRDAADVPGRLFCRGGQGYCPRFRLPSPPTSRSERPPVIKRLWNKFYGPEAEARRLNRDAAYIIHALTEEHYGPIGGQVAGDLRKDIDYMLETFIRKDEVYGYKRAQDHMSRLHNEARKRRDQRALTSLTLAIIYMRAAKVGAPARAATAAIDAYLEEWSPVPDEDSGVMPPSVN
jgi:hypothetical protein